MYEINGHTRVYGILGDPVAHSLSPVMQNLAITKAGLDAVYLPFHVTSENLCSAVAGIRCLGLGGVNVTLPHKQSVVSYLDQVDEDATLIGAVNTIVNRDGVLCGYNTDALGFIRSLKDDLFFDPAGKSVLLYGAGGACRAAVVALLRAGVSELTIVNRTVEKATQIATDFRQIFSSQKIDVRSVDESAEVLGRVDLVVNTTSIGLKGEALSLCSLSKIKSSASVYDMVYSTAETPFVCAARERGLVAADGIGMLAGQGEEAFALWFNRLPEHGIMKNCLLHSRAVNHS